MFLEIKGIRKSFGTGDSRVDVLKGLNLEIEKGEFCVLLGPSGSGKSTLLNIIGGIDVADEGSIIIEGEQLEDMTEKKLSLYRRKHLGYIFQMYNLIPNLTVCVKTSRWAHTSAIGPWMWMNLCGHWRFMNTAINCRIRFRGDSSSERRLAGPS